MENDYRRYRGIADDDSSQLADDTAYVVDDLDYVFAQEAHWERDSRSSFTAYDCSVIATDLARILKTVQRSVSGFANLMKGLVNELEAS